MSMRVMGVVLGGALLLGCGSTEEPEGSAEQQEIVDNLLELGFSAAALERVDGAVLLGGDAEVSLQASREMLGLAGETTQERWVSNNRVGSAVTRICVNGLAYGGVFGTALNGALAQLNSLGLRFSFQRTTGATAGCSAVITARTGVGFARSSGYPAGGLPYSSFTLGTGFASYDVASIRFQILHLLGHTLGLLHADVENPNISCGPGTGGIGGSDSPSPGGVGAIAIPGIPPATVGGSVMNTCYRVTEPGLLTPADRSLLGYVY